MDSRFDVAISWAQVGVTAALSAVVLVAAVLAVRHLAERGSWSPHRTVSLSWSVPLAAVAVLCLVLVRLVGFGSTATFGWVSYSPGPPRVTPTLIWLPCVLALLWSVLHALRGGAGRTPPLLDLPVAAAVPVLWFVSLPLQITVFTVGLLGSLTWVGLGLWLVGQALVAAGRATVGDVAVWSGVALVAADAWPGYVGLVSPVVVALLVARSARRRTAFS